MSRHKIDISKPLKKVRIIKAEDIDSESRLGSLPVINIKNGIKETESPEDKFQELQTTIDIDTEKESLGNYDIDLTDIISEQEKDEDEEETDEIIEEKTETEVHTEPETPTYFDEIKISNYDTPVHIDLSKIPEDSVSIPEAKQKIQEAYDNGFSDGKEVAGSTLMEDIHKQQKWIRNFDNIIHDLRIQFTMEFGKLEESISKLALIVAEHILDYEVTQNSDAFINQLRKAISELDNEIILKIHIHPDNYQALVEIKSELVEDKSRIENVKIVQDEKIGKGGCLLETNAGIIDARISNQLQKIKEALLKLPQSSDIQSEEDFESFEKNLEDSGNDKNSSEDGSGD